MSPANTTNDSTKAILQDPKYEIMNDILEEVHKKHVRVCKEETKVVNKNFKEVMVIFEMAMKEVDPTFKEIFNRFTYTGSFYEGLKISSPDEYDCNLIIKPKLKMIPLKRNRNCPPGHIAIQVIKDDKCSEKPYKDWLHYDQLSNRYFLKIDSIKSWLQGIVTKAKNKIEREKIIQRYKIDIHQSGPAWTLVLTLTDIKKQVSIDLVPCLEFKDKDWPGVPRKPKKLLKGVGSESWFAVPKGPRNFPKDLEKNKLWNEAWRMSFPIHEKHVLNGFYNLKFIVRLMKQLRDKLKIHKVASYYIKTLFLWEIEKENDNRMWQENGRGHLFIYMLVRFKEALEKENIPFFWEKECNLLEHIPTDYLKNNAGQVKRFIGKVESYIDKKDSAGLREFIVEKLCEPTAVPDLVHKLSILEIKLNEPIHVKTERKAEKATAAGANEIQRELEPTGSIYNKCLVQ